MVTQLAMPYPLKRMFEYLDLDIERSFETMQEMMEHAKVKCRMCKICFSCDVDLEKHYFHCPNRRLLDHLERMQGKI